MKLFQSLVSQIREIVKYGFGILDETGLVLACSNEAIVGQHIPDVSKAVTSKEKVTVIDGIAYQKVFVKGKLEFITFIEANSEECIRYLSLISINVSNIKLFNEEKFDRGNFVKNILLDNVLPSEIQFRAKELHLPSEVSRVVFLIRTEKNRDMYAYEIIQSLFPNKTKDFVIPLDDENTVLVREIKLNSDYKELEKTARVIVDTLNTESMVKAFIGVGTIVDNIRDIGRSFKEAQTALLIGGIFESEKPILNYNNLGLGRLIYQLPATLCKLFLKEVFNDGSYESLDSETLFTIQKFFEDNLNISETSRQLYVHRNTLVYRLDKIEKLTGLDLRKFDDAIIFKVSMLVKRYLDKCEKPI